MKVWKLLVAWISQQDAFFPLTFGSHHSFKTLIHKPRSHALDLRPVVQSSCKEAGFAYQRSVARYMALSMTPKDLENKQETNNDESEAVKAPQKFHHFTICMVPPEDEQELWQALTQVRTELKDPGLYRWPPHVNLLYPFISPYYETNEESHDKTASDLQQKETAIPLDNDTLVLLRQACRRMEPFRVTLGDFGTFGGKQRGVLWLNPQTDHEQLILLQSYLEEVFPFCHDQRKLGTFTPHMTLTHTPSLQTAMEAQAHLQDSWIPRTFVLKEIYLLGRKGDDGQFQKIATIPLGAGTEPESVIQYYQEDPVPFLHMPSVEVDWVREERMRLKKRRRKNASNGRQRRPARTPRIPDTPEVIAAKREARKAKHEAALRENCEGIGSQNDEIALNDCEED